MQCQSFIPLLAVCALSVVSSSLSQAAVPQTALDTVAIHQHMTGETPRMMFLHYYGRGKALILAQAVKAAVDTQRWATNN